MEYAERETRSKRRKPNFQDDEIWTLIQGIANDRVVIMNKLQSLATNKNKRDAWRKITKKVNSLGVSYRSEKDLKKKWKDLKCAVLNCIHNQKKTRGGYPMRPPPFVDMIMDIIGPNTDISPIDVDGTDSFALELEANEGQSEDNVVLETTFEGQSVTVHIKDEKMETSSIVVPIQKPRRPRPPMSLTSPSPQSPQPGPSRFMSVQPVSTSTSPASDAPSPEATATASIPVSIHPPSIHPSTPPTANRCIPLMMRSRRRKRRSTSSDTEAEESALFQKWLASDIAKNETKVKLMQLQITKLQRELVLE